MKIEQIKFDGKLIVDSFEIFLRNEEASKVKVNCGTQIGNQQINYNGLTISFKPDKELLDFFERKLLEAIKEDKIESTIKIDSK